MSASDHEERGEGEDSSPFPAAYGPVGESDPWRSSRAGHTPPDPAGPSLMEPVWPAAPPVDPPPERAEWDHGTAEPTLSGAGLPAALGAAAPADGGDAGDAGPPVPTRWGRRPGAGWPAAERPRVRSEREVPDLGWGTSAGTAGVVGAAAGGVGAGAAAGGVGAGGVGAATWGSAPYTTSEPSTTASPTVSGPGPATVAAPAMVSGPVTGAVPVVPPGWSASAPSAHPRVVRHLVRRLDAWTVFKVSLVFYLLMLVVVLVAGVVAWQVAAGLGFIKDIEKLVKGLAVVKTFVLHGRVVLEYAAAAGLVLAIVGTLLNTIAALLYNVISDLFGGVQTITVARDELDED